MAAGALEDVTLGLCSPAKVEREQPRHPMTAVAGRLSGRGLEDGPRLVEAPAPDEEVHERMRALASTEPVGLAQVHLRILGPSTVEPHEAPRLEREEGGAQR